MSEHKLLTRALVVIALVWVFACGVWAHLHMQKVTITEQDIARYCTDRRRAHSSAKEIEFYCREMGGDYYIAQGIKPNYDKFPSYKMFPSTGEVR